MLVLRDEVKPEARAIFQTPLVFSVQEAKGLEYESIILFNFVSSERQSFAAIAEGLSPAEVEAGDLDYSRAADKSDKSLEVYKFFVNALYVALTRAVRNVYVIEADTRHPLLRLLGLEDARERLDIAEQKSTLEEWQYEAHRLEQQGKLEQAEEVRRAVLHVQAAPWPVFDVPALAALADRALDPASISNKPRQQLYDYAVYHDEPGWVEKLAEQRFQPARGMLALMQERDARLSVVGVNLVKRHHASYESRNLKEVLRQVDQYGVDFRNPFNHTPLMVAATRGNVPLVEALLARGANVEIADNHGRLAYHLALLRALLDADYARGPFEAMARLLAPQAVDLKVDERLVKLDAHLPEFFLVNAMLPLMQHRLNYPQRWHRPGLTVNDFLLPAAALPEAVLPERRRRRSYLSGVLSRNEISREYAYNRKLFARTGHGHYVLNPGLALRIGEDWTPIYDRLYPPEIDRHLGYRARLEEIIAFQAFYARDPEAAIASLRAKFEDEFEVDPAAETDSAASA
ncbi:MAG: ankyrin repeat domain-containing protein [Burkholderiales bacterium]